MTERTIIHMDLDSFFVSVECLRNDKLKGRPLIIGGSSGRGVVASCSYEARRFGVHSAMPTRTALQLCPDALIISGDMESYSYYSRMVTEIIAAASPLYEKASIDEFYIDATGMDRFFNTFQWSRELRQKIIENTGLPISMGLSVNKLVSKVATGEYKPNGEKKIAQGTERDFLAPLSVSKIPMIGEKTTKFLTDMGVHTVQVLRDMPIKVLERAFGKNGTVLWRKANAIDDTPVVPHSERKSISTECTFESDTIDLKNLRTVLAAMVEKLAFKLREENKLASCVAIKIRYANFDTETRQQHIPYTSADHIIMQVANSLFHKLYNRRMRVRLIGVRLSGLVHGHYQINLFDDTEETIRLYHAMDKIRGKFGTEAVVRASTIGVNERIRINNNPFTG